jgi:superfamily II DNA or RNA helicase
MNYEDRIYQSRAVAWLCKTRQGIVESPAGSGKTVIASTALARVTLSRERSVKVRVGWIAHTIEQCEQAVIALDQFPEAKKFMDIKIACAAAEMDWSDRDVLIVDECQWSGCGQWFNQISTCSGARWGFSATPFDEKDPTRNDIVRDLFGGKIFVISRNDIQDKLAIANVIVLESTDADIQNKIDNVANLSIKRRQRFWTGKKWELEAQCKWQACMEIGIMENRSRNDSIIGHAIQHSNDHVLILVNNIEHGEWLKTNIPGSHICFSKMGKKLRSATIEGFKSGRIPCLIATSLADEGLDVPIANVLILACGGRSENKVIQRTGRVLRKAEGKDSAIIYDFADNYHPMAANHFKKRMSIYKKLGYTIL